MAVITAEGPLFQFGNRGYPSGLKQGSGLALFLEAWTEVYMLQFRSTCSGYVFLFGVLTVKGLLIFAPEWPGNSSYDKMQGESVKIIHSM